MSDNNIYTNHTNRQDEEGQSLQYAMNKMAARDTEAATRLLKWVMQTQDKGASDADIVAVIAPAVESNASVEDIMAHIGTGLRKCVK